MAARLVKKRLTCLQNMAEKQTFWSHRCLIASKTRCPQKRVASYSVYSHSVIPHSSKFSTSRNYDFCESGKEVENRESQNNSFRQEISKCSSSKHLLDIVKNCGSISPDTLFFVFSHLEETKYEELREELPWLGTREMAVLQLKLCYGIDEKLSDIKTHPGWALLETCLEKNITQMSNEELGNIATSMFNLGCTSKSPVYKNLLDHLFSQIPNMTLRDLRASVYPVRMEKYVNPFKQTGWAFTDTIMNRLEELIQHNAIHTPEEMVNYMSIMVGLHDKCNMDQWRALSQTQEETSVSILEDLNSEHLPVISRYFLYALRPTDRPDDVLDAYGQYIMRNVHLIQIQHLPVVKSVFLRKREVSQDRYTALHMQSVRLFNLHKDNLRALDFVSLLHGFAADSYYKRRHEFEEYFRKVDFSTIDVFAIGKLASVFVRVKDPQLIDQYQRVLADRAGELCIYAAVLQDVAYLLMSQPIRDDDTRKDFITRIIAELPKFSSHSFFKMAHLSKALLANLSDGMPEILDYLIENIPKFPERCLSVVGESLVNVNHNIKLGPTMRAKLRQAQMVFYETCSEKVKESRLGIPGVTNLHITMASKDQDFADKIVSVLREDCRSDISKSNAVKITKFMRHIIYYDEEIMELLTARFLQGDAEYHLCLTLLPLLKMMGHMPKRSEEFLNQALKTCHKFVGQGSFLAHLRTLCSLLMLGFYPKKELSEIFTVEYLDQLDRYIERYPDYRLNVEYIMFELNRHVAIEYPELNVPFFGKSFAETTILPDLKRRVCRPSKFSEGVREPLLQLVQEIPSCLAVFSLSPYYHYMEFEVQLYQGNSFVPVEKFEEKNKSHQKVAINLLTKYHYCSNTDRVHGNYLDRRRQLKTIGYRVVEIPHFEWNSMALVGDEIKQNYLREKILGHRTEADMRSELWTWTNT